MISCEVSFYPLGHENINKIVNEFLSLIKTDKIKIETNKMSTYLEGENDLIFDTLKEVYKEISKKYGSVITIKISNVCAI
ncbi:MAG: YkoF family thiamine/hydroxymethylpyrimidine-binding protein [Candidatus Ranarchaeia archaeon]